MDENTRKLLTSINDRLKALDGHADAIKQMESWKRSFASDIEAKLTAGRALAYGPNGHYRGRFASEESAREFGLYLMSKTADGDIQRKAAEMLAGDHRLFADRMNTITARDVTGAQALIPHEHSARVHRLIEDSSAFAKLAFPMPMGSSELSFTRRVSGFRARKSTLRQAATKQDTQVAPINLTASNFEILTSYPKEIEDDAIVPIAELVLFEIVLGFSLALEEDGLIGDGTDAYDNVMGITTLLKSINGVDDGGGIVLGTAGNAGDGWNTIGKDDILRAIGAVRHARPGQIHAVCSNEFFWQRLAKIITDAGGVTKMEMEEGFRLSLLGVPVEISHVMPRVSGSSQIPLLIGDIYQSSTLGRRQALMIEQSREALFTQREIAVLGTGRWSINNHSLGDAATPGPVIGVMTKAAG